MGISPNKRNSPWGTPMGADGGSCGGDPAGGEGSRPKEARRVGQEEVRRRSMACALGLGPGNFFIFNPF
jgi:hypothetical protein